MKLVMEGISIHLSLIYIGAHAGCQLTVQCSVTQSNNICSRKVYSTTAGIMRKLSGFHVLHFLPLSLACLLEQAEHRVMLGYLVLDLSSVLYVILVP